MEHAPPGERLQNYRLDRLLGSGGMGSVYLAHDLALDRRVALKFIAPEKSGDESSRRRLIREARAAAALDHPNICGIHEVIDDPAGRPCIVMQFVEGETLAEMLKRGPLDVGVTLRIARDVAAALDAAHAHDVIHRDIKPQNIIVGAGNHAKLVDFGLAVQNPISHKAALETTTSYVTAPGLLVGTLPYMSPEQVAQRSLDPRTDIFSLGAVLYECLTGRRPFSAPSTAELVSQILEADPAPPSSLRRGLTRQHDELCRRLMAKDPAARFQTAREVVEALTAISGGAMSSSAARPRVLPASAITVLVVLISVVAWQWNRNRSPAPPSEVQRLFEQGVSRLHDGAHGSARRDFRGAIAAAPEFVPAHVRLAEACVELDDHRCAQDALNTIGALTPDDRLPPEDQARVRAVRWLLIRQLDKTVEEYTRLTRLRPGDAGAWVDLGRAQEAASQPALAKASFDKAIEIDSRYAAAHLRRASTLAQMGETQEALKAFGVAEDLYRQANNAEGHTEALLRRGAHLNAVSKIPAARDVLTRARTLAETLEHREQLIRADLQLSSVTMTQGESGKGADIALSAVQAAQADGLDTLAADGLIELATAMALTRGSEIASESDGL